MVQQFIRTLRTLQVDFKPEAGSRWSTDFYREQILNDSFETVLNDLVELKRCTPSGVTLPLSASSFSILFEKILESEEPSTHLCTAIMQIITPSGAIGLKDKPNYVIL
jgi:hypothetical protein